MGTNMKSRNERISFDVQEDLKNEAKSLANEWGLSMSEICRRGLVNQLRELRGSE